MTPSKLDTKTTEWLYHRLGLLKKVMLVVQDELAVEIAIKGIKRKLGDGPTDFELSNKIDNIERELKNQRQYEKK